MRGVSIYLIPNVEKNFQNKCTRNSSVNLKLLKYDSKSYNVRYNTLNRERHLRRRKFSPKNVPTLGLVKRSEYYLIIILIRLYSRRLQNVYYFQNNRKPVKCIAQ